MGIIQHKRIYGINNLINTPLWDLIQEKLNSSNMEWNDALVNDESNGYYNDIKRRNTKIAWIPDDLYLREQLFHSVNLYNQQTWNYDLDGCDSVQYGSYSDGGRYDWHVDEEPEIPNINGKYLTRKLSTTIWLNDPDEYEGGEFDIEVEGPFKDIRYNTLKLKKGSIVIFPSDKWHRVRPITSGVRKSLVTWFRGPPFR
tara:strand:+ start:195 stop:791 length:597 start_codon:yes stop_codon:yes gene_type:complete